MSQPRDKQPPKIGKRSVEVMRYSLSARIPTLLERWADISLHVLPPKSGADSRTSPEMALRRRFEHCSYENGRITAQLLTMLSSLQGEGIDPHILWIRNIRLVMILVCYIPKLRTQEPCQGRTEAKKRGERSK